MAQWHDTKVIAVTTELLVGHLRWGSCNTKGPTWNQVCFWYGAKCILLWHLRANVEMTKKTSDKTCPSVSWKMEYQLGFYTLLSSNSEFFRWIPMWNIFTGKCFSGFIIFIWKCITLDIQLQLDLAKWRGAANYFVKSRNSLNRDRCFSALQNFKL